MRMREPVVYAVLLVFALGFAYRTWTREDGAAEAASGTVLWDESADAFVSAAYESADRSVHIERRGSGEDAYLWARVLRTRIRDRRVDADSTVRIETVDTTAFVVGRSGDKLLEALAVPRALRDLGTPDPARLAEYGLADSTAHVVVRFRDGEHTLVVGGSVYAAGDRYVLDPSTGRAYVLAGVTVDRLEDARTRLPERRLHDFEPDDVVEVVVTADGRERTMHHADGARPGEDVWTAPDAPDRPDQTFANFMLRLHRLPVSGYRPGMEPSTLEPIVRIRYFGADREPLGFFELFRRTAADGEPTYVLRTELTRVAATTIASLAAEVAADVEQLF